jgi:hypothetical protein
MFESRVILSDFSRIITYADIIDFDDQSCTIYIPDYYTYINLIKTSLDTWSVVQSDNFYNPRWITEILHHIANIQSN